MNDDIFDYIFLAFVTAYLLFKAVPFVFFR